LDEDVQKQGYSARIAHDWPEMTLLHEQLLKDESGIAVVCVTWPESSWLNNIQEALEGCGCTLLPVVLR
jgi:hypothetical protein